MAKKEILPAVNKYIVQLLESAERKQRLIAANFAAKISSEMESDLITLLSELEDNAYKKVNELEGLLAEAAELDKGDDKLATALFYKDKIIPAMKELRSYIDRMESNTAKEVWPLPSYGEMLFSV